MDEPDNSGLMKANRLPFYEIIYYAPEKSISKNISYNFIEFHFLPVVKCKLNKVMKKSRKHPKRCFFHAMEVIKGWE